MTARAPLPACLTQNRPPAAPAAWCRKLQWKQPSAPCPASQRWIPMGPNAAAYVSSRAGEMLFWSQPEPTIDDASLSPPLTLQPWLLISALHGMVTCNHFGARHAANFTILSRQG